MYCKCTSHLGFGLVALLNGIHHLEPVDLSAHNGPKDVMVRPLSSAEAGRVEQMKLQGIRADVQVEGAAVNATPVVEDISLLLEKQRQARVITVQFGLSHSGEECTYEQARQMPAAWVEALARVVQRISGIQDQEDTFRDGAGMGRVGQNGGHEDAPDVPGRDTAREDAGGDHTAPA